MAGLNMSDAEYEAYKAGRGLCRRENCYTHVLDGGALCLEHRKESLPTPPPPTVFTTPAVKFSPVSLAAKFTPSAPTVRPEAYEYRVSANADPILVEQVTALKKQRDSVIAASMKLADRLGTQDHNLREAWRVIGQLTMERDEALRQAGRR